MSKKGSPWLKELYELFAPVRAEAGRYGKKEVEKTLDQALTKCSQNPMTRVVFDTKEKQHS